MGNLLYTLVFISSGVSYFVDTDLSLSDCVSQLIIQKEAIQIVQTQFPKLEMTVYCKPQ